MYMEMKKKTIWNVFVSSLLFYIYKYKSGA